MSQPTSDHDRLQVVVFTVGAEEYAVPVHRVESIIAGTDPTQVPGAGKHVRGVYNLRGRVISIIDLRSRLDVEPRPAGATSRVLVVTSGGHTVGLEVDEVSEVFTVDPAQLQGPPRQLTDTSIVSGILKLENRLVIIVDTDALIGAGVGDVNPVAATA